MRVPYVCDLSMCVFFFHGSLPWMLSCFTVIQATTGGFDWEDALRLVGQAGQGERANTEEHQQEKQQTITTTATRITKNNPKKTPTDNN